MKPAVENLHTIIIRQLACSIHLDDFSKNVLSQILTGCNAQKANQKLVYFCMKLNHKIYKLIQEPNLEFSVPEENYTPSGHLSFFGNHLKRKISHSS